MARPIRKVRALDALIDDAHTKAVVQARIAEALVAAEFCRDWRNTHIAHRDHSLALHGGNPLKPASRLKIAEAITALRAVLSAVSLHYLDSTTSFEHDTTFGGALALPYVLDSGVSG